MMVVQRGSRLSIQPVRSEEWREVLLMAKISDPVEKE
jgi:predicted RNA-binding protein with PUA-like domain